MTRRPPRYGVHIPADADDGYMIDSGVSTHPDPATAVAMLVVDHLANLWGVSVDERQATNDEADAYVKARVLEALNATSPLAPTEGTPE